MSRVVPSLKPCDSNLCDERRKVYEPMFFLTIYLISIGTGGHKPSLESFGADQFDDENPEERRKKMEIIRKTTGSPLTPMLNVLVAAIRKRNLQLPSNPSHLHEVPKSETTQRSLLSHTRKLEFLDKAAILDGTQDSVEQQQNPWKLATVTVEELKLIINMIPIWLTTLPFGICVAQAATFFIKQCVTMNRKIIHNFEIPQPQFMP
ncbi:hypothetical protein K7X08_007257 [Anisodus acutangulus]|uniref:Uncharacterized protein n=1 Tax=Anisodus acutangulus TaxID=402998 RepID=A0A9Q1LDP8_9SOLA|nr:hypothetical protein K7X08_007257 [Anisodus acutangulus]